MDSFRFMIFRLKDSFRGAILKRCFCLLLLILIAAISTPYTSAGQIENYHNYSMLQIESKVSSTINVKADGDRPYLKKFEVLLSFFPRDTERQVAVNKIKTYPSAEVEKSENAIKIVWKDIKPGTINYTIESDIKTFNRFNKIKNKINFPLTSSDFYEYDKYRQYLQPTENIDITPDIKSKAESIVKGETDLTKAVFKISSWIEKNIKYDLSTMTAEAIQKASWVLQNKRGVCDELTNLHIAMLRSVGIPARFVSGQVYSNIHYSFGNHGWTEVYMPSQGWVPVDVTFKQYGFIDPSHITFSVEADSGHSSAEYRWEGRDVKIESSGLKVESRVVKAEGTMDENVDVSIKPLINGAGPGSYVPLRATITNHNDYYIPLTIYLTKAPQTEESNSKPLLLEPYETKSVFWIVKLPSNITERYIYEVMIEAKTTVGAGAETSLRYSAMDRIYTRSEAQKLIDKLYVPEEKKGLPMLKMSCTPLKNIFYESENITVECLLQSSADISNLKICFRKECKTENMQRKVQKKVLLSARKAESGEYAVRAMHGDAEKTSFVNIKVIKKPEINITGIKPESISYNEVKFLEFDIEPSSPVQNVEILVDNAGKIKIDMLRAQQRIKIPLRGRDILSGTGRIKLYYEDEAGKPYFKTRKFEVKVNDMPWYAWILKWIRIW